MTAKTCTDPNCEQGNPQPLTNFAVARTSKDGRRGVCKSCRNRAYRAKHAANPMMKNAANRARYAADPSNQQAASRAWYASNRGRKSETQKAWREANPDRVRGYDASRRARELKAVAGPVDFEAARTCRADCYLCGYALGVDTHVDHIVPLNRGGAHAMSNLLPTHPTCNRRKADLLLSELSWYAGPVDLGAYA